MRALFLLTCLVMVSVATSVASAQTGEGGEVRRINLYVTELEAMTGKGKKPDQVFADTAPYETADRRPSWRRFDSEAALIAFREKTSETYKVAFVWTKKGKPVVANFTLFSPSGDWAQYDLHYFRPDGSIAKIDSELRTFYGNFVLKRELWFDRRGRRIASSRSYSDLETGKPLTKPAETFETDVRRYRRTSDLPFIRLVPRPR